MKLYFEPGIQPWGRPRKPEDLSREDISATFPDHAPNKVARFWVEQLDGNTVRRLRLSTEPVETDDRPSRRDAGDQDRRPGLAGLGACGPA